jgi:hypothetical protein
MGQGVTTCEETRGRFKIEYSSSSRSNVHQTSALRGTATRRASGWNPTRELAWCHATQHASPRRSVRRNRTASAHCVRGGAARLPRFKNVVRRGKTNLASRGYRARTERMFLLERGARGHVCRGQTKGW